MKYYEYNFPKKKWEEMNIEENNNWLTIYYFIMVLSSKI